MPRRPRKKKPVPVPRKKAAPKKKKPEPKILPTGSTHTILSNPFIVIPHCWTAARRRQPDKVNIIECGVFSGFLAVNMVYMMSLLFDSDFTYYALDTFEGFPYDGEEQKLYKKGDLAPENPDRVEALLNEFGVTVVRGKVEDTLDPLLENEELLFDFAFIDLDLLAPTKFCTERLKPRIRVGGRIGFHDYDHNPKYALKALAPYIDSQFRNDDQWLEARRKLNKIDKRFVFFEKISDGIATS